MQTSYGRTALDKTIEAEIFDNNDKALNLIRKFYNYNKKMDRVRTILAAAGAQNNESSFSHDYLNKVEIKKCIIEGRKIFKWIFFATDLGNTKEIAKLAKDYTFNIKDQHGNTPLHIAVLNNDKLMAITIIRQ